MRNNAVCLIAVIGFLLLPAAGQMESRDAREHLRHPQIVYDADSETYYLTGTTNINTLDAEFADFQNNDGVRLWKSRDLKEWEDIGLVWNLKTDPYRKKRKHWHGQWQGHLRIVPGQPDRKWSRGVTAPEIHQVGDDWYIVFALNDQAVGLLKSDSGRPEGPYREVGRLHNKFLGGDPSLFANRKGDVYFLWGAGMIAGIDLKSGELREKPWCLLHRIEGFPMEKRVPGQCGERGPFLVQQGGTYRLIFAAWTERGGKRHFDTLVCEADRIDGPYSPPEILIPDGGQATTFKGADGAVHAACSKRNKAISLTELAK